MELLPDLLESVARLRVKVAGTFKGARREVNFTSSDSSVTITGTDDSVNERMTVDLVAAGAELWESVAGDLHPITDPDTFSVLTTTGALALEAANRLTLEADAGDIDITSDVAAVSVSGATGVGLGTGDADITLDTTSAGRILLNCDVVHIGAGESAPSFPIANHIVFYLDEVGNNLKVRVTYSDGTTHKTGTIALA